MKLNKVYILSLLGLICGGILFSSRIALAADNPSGLVQMSAVRFWAEVNNLSLKDKDKDYIICGTEVCDPEGTEPDGLDAQRCISRVITHRKDHMTSLTDGAQDAGLTVMGGAAVTTVATGGAAAPAAAGAAVLGGATYLIGKSIQVVRGRGEVTTYEYKCIPKTAALEPGWSEASEGGWVMRRKVRIGGWFDKTKEQGSCFGGNDGQLYCLAARGGIATVNYNAADTAFRGCEVLPVKLYNNRKCFFCPLFTVVYKVAGDITDISFQALGGAFALLLAMGLAIWIAVQTLTQVSSLTKQDAPKFLGNLIKQGYKVLIAFLLLQYSSQIFEYGITPVLEAGLEFGSAMLEEKYTVMKTEEGLSDFEKMEELNPGIMNRVSTLSNTRYYTSGLYMALDNFVVNLQRNIAFMQSVGSSLICIGGNAMMFKGEDASFGSGFQMVIQGVLLAGFGFMLSIAFAFYLVDAVVQMGIAGALMPFLIASWPFKLTAKYANTGWSMILNSAFVFVFAGLVLSVNLNLVSAALDMTASGEQTDTIETKQCDNPADCADTEINMGGLYKIAQAINNQDETELVRLTDISAVGFLILLFCCIFGFKFLGRAGELAGKFASGALKPIAPSIATMGASAAKSMALKTTQSTREAVEDKVKAGARTVASVPGRLWGAVTGRGKYGKKGAAAGGAEDSGGAGGSGGGADAEEDDDLPGTEDGADDEAGLSINEGASSRPQTARSQSGNIPQGRRGTVRVGEGTGTGAAAPVATVRMNEAAQANNNNGVSGGGAAQGTASGQAGNEASGGSERANSGRDGNAYSSQGDEATNVEKARRSGKRNNSGGKAKSGSRGGRSRKYNRKAETRR